MNFPNHNIRTYCLFLGTFKHKHVDYDMGVYVYEDEVSHAIVYSEADECYISGDISYCNGSTLLDENIKRYNEYLTTVTA